MDAYHSDEEAVEPGEHKVFNIASTIHSYNLPGQETLHPYLKALRDAGVDYVMNMSQQMKDSLVDTIKSFKDPSTWAMPGEIGAIRPFGGILGRDRLIMKGEPSVDVNLYTTPKYSADVNLYTTPRYGENRTPLEKVQDLVEKGHSYSEIAAKLDMTRGQIAGLLNRAKGYTYAIKKQRAESGIRGTLKEGPYKPPVTEAQGDPEYEKALSDWMKNQFEGGPVEGESFVKTPEDFNTYNEFQAARSQTHVANENIKGKYDTAGNLESGFDVDVAWNQLKHIDHIYDTLNKVRGQPNEELLLNQRMRQLKNDAKLTGQPLGGVYKMEHDSYKARLDEMKRMSNIKFRDLPPDEK